MGIAIFAPELITTTAWGDWRNARKLVKALNEQQVSQEPTIVKVLSKFYFSSTDVLTCLQPNQTESPQDGNDGASPISRSNNLLETSHKVKLVIGIFPSNS
jgi:hypothetical protein